MYEHYRALDAYYAEQAIAYTLTGYCPPGADAPVIDVPLRWVAVWLVSLSSLGLGLGTFAQYFA